MRVTQERLAPLGISGGFFALGLLAFALVPVWVGWRWEPLVQGWASHPDVVFLVHLYVLGWGTSVAVGALRQLSVVLFQTPDAGPTRSGLVSLILFALGLIGFFVGVGTLRYAVTSVGGLLIFGTFLLTIAAAYRSMRQRSRTSVALPFLVGSLAAMMGAIVVGALLAAHNASGMLGSLRTAALAAHLYLGPVGWFGLLIPGVSYELAPFFGLTRGGEDKGLGRFPHYVAGLLLAGLFGGLIAALLGMFHPLWLLPLAAGYGLFVVDLRGLFRRRALIRRTATLVGVRAGHVCLAMLVVMIVIGVVWPSLWSDGRWLITFGWLGLAGWMGNSVAGYLHRILPFLAWHSRYWGASKEEIRTRFQDMVDQRLGRIGFYVHNSGVALIIAGIWGLPLFAVGVVLLAVGTWILAFNLVRVYFR